MANTILLKRSGTAGKVPVLANLSLGELSINSTDGRLYTTNGSAIVDLTQNDKITLSGDATGTSTNPAAGGNYSNLAVTLATVNSNTGTWGGANGQLPYFVVNGKGLVTVAGNIALNTQAVTNLGNTTDITSNATVGLAGLSLTTTGVSAGNYGSASSVPTIVVDSKGRITSVTTNAISTSFTVAGTSGTATVAGGSTLTFASTNGVTVAVGATYANISTPQNIQTTASPTFAGGTFNGTVVASAVNAPTIGNTGAAITGTIQTGSQTNITAVGTLTGLTVSGATTLNTVSAGSFQGIIGNATPAAGTFTSIASSTTATLNTVTGASFQGIIGNATPAAGTFTSATVNGTVVASVINAATIGNASAVLYGTLNSSSASQPNITTLAGLTSLGTAGATTSVLGNLAIGGNLTVTGQSVSIGASTLSITDPIININTPTDLTPLSSTTTADIGLKFHYYDTADSAGFAGRTVSDGFFTYWAKGTDTANVFTGTVYGTIKSGALWLANTTAATGTTSGTAGALYVAGGAGIAGALYAGSIQNTPIGSTTASTGAFTTITSSSTIIGSGNIVAASGTASSSTTTGALVVAGTGGLGVGGAVYAGSLYDNGNRTLTTASTHSNSGGDASVSGAYNALVLTLNTVNSTTGLFGNATYHPQVTVNAKGLVTAVANVLVQPAWSSITSTPTTLSGYGITDALSTSSTIDGGTY